MSPGCADSTNHQLATVLEEFLKRGHYGGSRGTNRALRSDSLSKYWKEGLTMDSAHPEMTLSGARAGSAFSQGQASWVWLPQPTQQEPQQIHLLGIFKSNSLSKWLALVLLSSNMYLFLVGSLQSELFLKSLLWAPVCGSYTMVSRKCLLTSASRPLSDRWPLALTNH